MRSDATPIARALLASLALASLLLAIPLAEADPYTPDAETDVPSSIGTAIAM